MDIHLTQGSVLPPGHWIYPDELRLQATGYTSDTGQSSANWTLDKHLKLDRVLQGQWKSPDHGKSSATRTVDIPLTLDRVLPPGHWTYP
ncbi:hypothetical protein TNIN_31571 [Trichonephila inaurata madagascariensis]|uniref:Uncharacterized protein n=1 Tax=Trichonephila inaurata madagascariensis TaxID=2747483 RepID=A0A8X6WY89_9ARAC|nr:hypothetical protein TNIN_31571 [Trichonephila inaurata madagascariensis]